MLENTLLMRLRRREVDRLDAGFGDAHHFAGLDFADVFCVEQIEGTGFAGDDPGFFALRRDEFAKIQWTEAARIANGVKLFWSQNDERVRAFDLIERVAERSGKIARL